LASAGTAKRKDFLTTGSTERAEVRGQRTPRLNGSANAEFNWAGKTRILECWPWLSSPVYHLPELQGRQRAPVQQGKNAGITG